MLKELNNGSKIGLLILAVAGMIVGILILLGKSVPVLFVWTYFAGMAIVFISSLFAKREKNNREDK